MSDIPGMPVQYSDDWIYNRFSNSQTMAICKYIDSFKKTREYTTYRRSVAHAYDGLYGVYCQLREKKWSDNRIISYLAGVRRTVESGSRAGRIVENEPSGPVKSFDEAEVIEETLF